jgi:HPt (histidine-containing phosphotransfer) domain-containing protein
MGYMRQVPASTTLSGSGSDCGVKPVDLVYLRRFTMGNRELEREVLQLFVTQAPVYLRLLRAAESVKQWTDAAHTLKGAARAIGAWRVALCAENAEKLKSVGDCERRVRALEIITAALDEARTHITDVICSN